MNNDNLRYSTYFLRTNTKTRPIRIQWNFEFLVSLPAFINCTSEAITSNFTLVVIGELYYSKMLCNQCNQLKEDQKRYCYCYICYNCSHVFTSLKIAVGLSMHVFKIYFKYLFQQRL